MRSLYSLTLALATLWFLGCGDGKTPEQQAEKTPASQTDGANHDDHHEHPDKGPHGGSLIELGEEQYHGELVLNKEQGTVTVYILDAHVENAVPIEGEEITISEQSQAYPLKAQPQESDPPGKSSRFVAEDKELAELLSGHVHARLLLKIDGKSFNGSIDSH